MDARDADARRVAAVIVLGNVDAFGRPLGGKFQVKMTTHAKRERTLRRLEVLCHVRIEVALAVEHRVLLDVTISRQAGEHDALDGRLVGNG